MHPIERLRMVARAAGEGPALIAQEAAGALVAFGDEPAGLVTACRRLVDRQPTSGPIWWLAARVLCSSDPTQEAWRAVEELQDDPTSRELAAALPDGAVVTVVGLGRVLPGRLWDALASRLADDDEPWLAPEEVVPADLVDYVVGPDGVRSAAEAIAAPTCPVAPELLKEAE